MEGRHPTQPRAGDLGVFERVPTPTVDELVADRRPLDQFSVSDANGAFVRLPDALSDLRDASPRVRERSMFGDLHPNDRLAAARAFITVTRQGGGSLRGVVRVVDPEGRSCRAHEVLFADHLDDPDVAGVVVRLRPVPGAPVEPVVVDDERLGWKRPSSIVSFLLDGGGTIVSIAGPIDELLGWAPEPLVGRQSLDLIHPDDHAAAANAFMDLSASHGTPMRVRHRLVCADGAYRWTEATLSPAGDGLVRSVCHDIAEQVELEERLDWQASHDSLTGLLNRSGATRALAQLTAPDGPPDLAVVFVDLDDFKDVNDTLGHDIGDDLLRVLSHRFEAEVRGGDVIGRLGGDEFLVICRQVSSDETAIALAERLLDAASSSVTVNGMTVRCTASVGVARQRPDDWQDATALVRDADTAMYEAKRAGRNRVVLFDDSLRVRLNHRVRIQGDLRTALERDLGLEPWFHTVRSAADPSIVHGVEALVRWRLPSGEVLPPSAFLPVASQARLMPQIDRWMLQHAIKQMSGTVAATAPEGWFGVGINLSGETLCQPGAVDSMLDDVHLAGFDPAHLVVEVTETEAIDNLDTVVEVMGRFKDAGVRVALDDFGVGYSSLTHLRRIPADILKLDHTFVADLVHDEQVRIIFESVVAMANRLGLCVIAEGIETTEQLELARDLGVASVQGYLWGAPVPAEELPFRPRG